MHRFQLARGAMLGHWCSGALETTFVSYRLGLVRSLVGTSAGSLFMFKTKRHDHMPRPLRPQRRFGSIQAAQRQMKPILLNTVINMSLCNVSLAAEFSFVFVYDPSDVIVSCSSLYLVFPSHFLQVFFMVLLQFFFSVSWQTRCHCQRHQRPPNIVRCR
jgi:hypothetical protein